MPTGSERFLNTRSLRGDHRRLDALLEPGMSVLDVGCGAGAITRGIAEAVGPEGRVVGIDISEELLALALQSHAEPANLSFEIADVTRHHYRDEFDVVTAARVLQWLADPGAALAAMVAAAKPGGQIIVLDYDHTRARWTPSPPEPFVRFYDAFLGWRADAGMDNQIAVHLEAMMLERSLEEVSAKRGDRARQARRRRLRDEARSVARRDRHARASARRRRLARGGGARRGGRDLRRLDRGRRTQPVASPAGGQRAPPARGLSRGRPARRAKPPPERPIEGLALPRSPRESRRRAAPVVIEQKGVVEGGLRCLLHYVVHELPRTDPAKPPRRTLTARARADAPAAGHGGGGRVARRLRRRGARARAVAQQQLDQLAVGLASRLEPLPWGSGFNPLFPATGARSSSTAGGSSSTAAPSASAASAASRSIRASLT